MFSGIPAAIFPRSLLLWRILLVCIGLSGMSAPARVRAGDAALDVRETLMGIIAYTRWPVEPQPLRLCVLGQGPQTVWLLQEALERPGHPPVQTRRPDPDTQIASHCDVLYVGDLPAEAWRELLPPLTGRAVLTVCERSPACTAGGMVRLDIGAKAGPVRFEVNLDAVARSVVRIHPQVLRLGRRPPGASP
jgi:hypothetical protein